MIWASALLLVASAIGLTLHLLQLVAMRRHLAGAPRVPRRRECWASVSRLAPSPDSTRSRSPMICCASSPLIARR